MFTVFLRIFTKNVIPISLGYLFDMTHPSCFFHGSYKQAFSVTGM